MRLRRFRRTSAVGVLVSLAHEFGLDSSIQQRRIVVSSIRDCTDRMTSTESLQHMREVIFPKNGSFKRYRSPFFISVPASLLPLTATHFLCPSSVRPPHRRQSEVISIWGGIGVAELRCLTILVHPPSAHIPVKSPCVPGILEALLGCTASCEPVAAELRWEGGLVVER